MGFELDEGKFKATLGGKQVRLYTLSDRAGSIVAKITNYGATMVQLKVPDRDGRPGDVILGSDNLEDLVAMRLAYAGAVVGRYANRIAGARFVLDGVEYELDCNEAAFGNTLHGGARGAHQAVFDVVESTQSFLRLMYVFEDGEEGFPGRCELTVTYAITEDARLTIEYAAATDKRTVVNFTQHNYWNLAGAGSGAVMGHELYINASKYTPINERLAPTGELQDLHGTPLDFSTSKPLGRDIDARHPQIERCRGYDMNYVLDSDGDLGVIAARLCDPSSGRVMEIFTTEPGLQLYSGNFIPDDGSLRGKDGLVYARRGGVCLETQHFPNSPNEPRFPSTVLSPGQTFASTTTHRFSKTAGGR